MIDYNKIRQSVPLIEAAKRYGSVKHGFMRCPFHADRTPSLKLYGDHFHCFGCGAHGDVIDLTAGLLGCSKSEAAKRLEADFGCGGFVPPLGLAACKRELSRCRNALAPKSPGDAIADGYAEACTLDGCGREPGRDAAGRAENRTIDGGFAWLRFQNGTMASTLMK